MPVPARTWSTNDYVTAEYLNTDLYSYVPFNNHFPNGLLFHSMTPMMHAWADAAGLVVTSAGGGGAATNLSDTGTNSHWGQTACTESLYVGSNGPYQGKFLPRVQGADSGPVTAGGGNYLVYSQICWQPQTNTTGYAGASLSSFVSAPEVHGATQLPSTVRQNMPWCFDLVEAASQVSNTIDFQPEALCQDSSANNFGLVSNSNASGAPARAGYMWCGVGGKNSPPLVNGTVPPGPTLGWATASSANLQGGLRNPLWFLNNRPQLRTSAAQVSGAVPTNTNVILQWASDDYDNYTNYNASTHQYTVPMDGVYLCYTMVEFNGSIAQQLRTGFQINGSLNLFGPSYSTSSGAHLARAQSIRLLDLRHNDTVAAICSVTGAAASTTGNGKMVLVWMGTLATSGTPLTFNPPDIQFRWPAGAPGSSALMQYFNEHAGQDLGFLLQRPYALAYQTTAQSGLANNTIQAISCQNNTGRVHASFGDNYGGWSGPSNYRYVAQVPGWYLAVGGVFQGFSGTTPYVPSYGFTCLNSVGANIGNYTVHQKSSSATSGINVEGAEGLLFVYLYTGDSLYPTYQQLDGAGTFSTTVSTAGCESHFGLVWVSE